MILPTAVALYTSGFGAHWDDLPPAMTRQGQARAID